MMDLAGADAHVDDGAGASIFGTYTDMYRTHNHAAMLKMLAARGTDCAAVADYDRDVRPLLTDQEDRLFIALPIVHNAEDIPEKSETHVIVMNPACTNMSTAHFKSVMEYVMDTIAHNKDVEIDAEADRERVERIIAEEVSGDRPHAGFIEAALRLPEGVALV